MPYTSHVKTERLMGMAAVLLKRKNISTAELARLFEVSRRTVLRDIEALSMAGIPVRTMQGHGGGVSLMEGFTLDHALLSEKETGMMLSALRGLASATGDESYTLLMEKLKEGSSSYLSGSGHMLIDLRSWGGEETVRKISLIEQAIAARRCVTFTYSSPKGESERCVEPYYLVFRWSSWYIWGWCRVRGDFRLFKLSRMTSPLQGEVFTPRIVPYPELSDEKVFPKKERFQAVFTPDVKWRLVENLSPDDMKIQSDGSILVDAEFSDEEGILSWMLTFGRHVKVLGPEHLVNLIKQRAAEIMSVYEEDP